MGSSDQAAFLVLILGGVVCLVAGIVQTRLNWRPDAPRYGDGTPLLQVFFHPERFATKGAVQTIRGLNLMGTVTIVSAIGILVQKAFNDFWR